jgi:single-stranded DNA-specific DHH superfamily exonuclease
MFMMDITTLLSLCNDLETQYNLNPSRRMNIIGKVTMLIYTIALGASNREVHERLQHSGDTV